MFSKQYRLRESQKIAHVFKIGKHVHGKYIFVKYIPTNKKNAHIAISVSTKLFKQATKRNRIKRQIREAVKPHLLKLPPMDILIITKKELKIDIPSKDINTDISNIFNRLISPKH